ncbi:MAG: flagellar biosynthesis protein [Roseovarius sp.]
MSLQRLLENFADQTTAPAAAADEEAIEDLKLEAFETGYRAGWDDCARAQQDSRNRLSEDFARNIRDLSFTYHEAHAGFVAAMKPLIGQMVSAVLPELAHATLGARVAALIEKEIASHGRQPVVLTTAPDSAETLQGMLPAEPGFPIEIRQDETLAEGQVQLSIGHRVEREIHLGELLEGIRAATETFFAQTEASQRETA